MSHRESFDLRMTNDRHVRKQSRLGDFRQRTAKRRQERRQLRMWLTGLRNGWIR